MSGWSRAPVRRTLCAVMGLLFVVAAVVQLDDPDSLRWIVLYAVAGALALVEAFGGRTALRWLLFVPELLVAAVALVWCATLVPGVLREASWSGSEIEREAGGLLLVGVTMLAIALTPQDI